MDGEPHGNKSRFRKTNRYFFENGDFVFGKNAGAVTADKVDFSMTDLKK